MKKILIIIGKIIAALAALYVIATVGFYFWLKNQIDFEFRDVSHEATYKEVIGTKYSTNNESYIVKFEQDNGAFNGKQWVYAIARSKEEAENNYKTHKEINLLPENTIIVLDKVVRCCNDIKQTDALIKIISTTEYNDAPIYFDDMELMVRNEWTRKIE